MPGIYVVRLRQGSLQQTLRAIVLP